MPKLQQRIKYEIIANENGTQTIIGRGICRHIAQAQKEWRNRVAKGTRPAVARVVNRIGWGSIQFTPTEIIYI